MKNLSAQEMHAQLVRMNEQMLDNRAALLSGLERLDRDRVWAAEGYPSLERYLAERMGIHINELEEWFEGLPSDRIPSGIREILEAHR